MDFLSDSLFNGWRFRALIEVDNYIRECLAIHAGQALKGEDVVSIMDALRGLDKRLPVRIQTDNGSLRDNLRNIHWFLSQEDAQDKLDKCRREYNDERTH
ncbi:Integrase [Salmonella enterica subsp. enterica]|nr:Integrase [Salmonella enterica subsp. enterica]